MSKKDVINVDTRKLAEDLNSIKSSLDNVQVAYNMMNKTHDTVKTKWKGEAAKTFSNSFDTCLGNIRYVYKILSNDIESLYEKCKAFRDCEDSVVKKVKGMDLVD